MLLRVGRLLLSANHAGVIDPHGLVADGHLLGFFSRGTRRAALLARGLATQFGNLDTLRLRAGIARTRNRIAARVGVLRAALLAARLLATGLRTALGTTLLALLTRLLTGSTTARRQAHRRITLLAATTAGRRRILILRAAYFAATGVFITGQFEIPDHAGLGFFVGCMRRAVQQRRIRKNAACGA